MSERSRLLSCFLSATPTNSRRRFRPLSARCFRRSSAACSDRAGTRADGAHRVRSNAQSQPNQVADGLHNPDERALRHAPRSIHRSRARRSAARPAIHGRAFERRETTIVRTERRMDASVGCARSGSGLSGTAWARQDCPPALRGLDSPSALPQAWQVSERRALSDPSLWLLGGLGCRPRGRRFARRSPRVQPCMGASTHESQDRRRPNGSCAQSLVDTPEASLSSAAYGGRQQGCTSGVVPRQQLEGRVFRGDERRSAYGHRRCRDGSHQAGQTGFDRGASRPAQGWSRGPEGCRNCSPQEGRFGPVFRLASCSIR